MEPIGSFVPWLMVPFQVGQTTHHLFDRWIHEPLDLTLGTDLVVNSAFEGGFSKKDLVKKL